MPDAKVHKTEKTFEKRKPPWGKNHQWTGGEKTLRLAVSPCPWYTSREPKHGHQLRTRRRATSCLRLNAEPRSLPKAARQRVSHHVYYFFLLFLCSVCRTLTALRATPLPAYP
jgi:hypothetical protein